MDEISNIGTYDPVSELGTHILSKRHTLSCVTHDNADDATIYHIRGGISHLRGVKGKPTLTAGKCERVSCEWGDAIIWCNDVSTYLSYYESSNPNFPGPALFLPIFHSEKKKKKKKPI